MDYDFIASGTEIKSAQDVVQFLERKALRAYIVINSADPSDEITFSEAPANMVANCTVDVISFDSIPGKICYQAYVEPQLTQV